MGLLHLFTKFNISP